MNAARSEENRRMSAGDITASQRDFMRIGIGNMVATEENESGRILGLDHRQGGITLRGMVRSIVRGHSRDRSLLPGESTAMIGIVDLPAGLPPLRHLPHPVVEAITPMKEGEIVPLRNLYGKGDIPPIAAEKGTTILPEGPNLLPLEMGIILITLGRS